MTAAEQMLSDAVDLLSSEFASDATFYLDKIPTPFKGVCNITQLMTEPTAGGRDTDAELRIVASRHQFETAGVIPTVGMSIRFKGRRWVLDGLSETDEPAYTLRCSLPQNR